MRTLVISDLHLGNRVKRDVLRLPAAQERLLAALADVDRLVLLGDVVELVTRNARRAMAAAEPVLRAIGRRLGPECEVVLVPGNHDAPLIRAWARARGPELETHRAVPADASRALARIVSWLGPAPVRIHYPGVWLDERTYAFHGHYLDRHLLPESPLGLPRGRLNHRPVTPARAPDYERGRIRSHHRRESLPGRGLERSLSIGAGLATRLVIPHLPRLLFHAQLAPLTAALADTQVRHAAIPSLERVLARLDLSPEVVLFGHVHRRGPVDGERSQKWQAADGMKIFNTGSWLYEPLLLDRASAPHPYWPGGAVLIETGSEPCSVGLLDDLGHSQLRVRGT